MKKILSALMSTLMVLGTACAAVHTDSLNNRSVRTIIFDSAHTTGTTTLQENPANTGQYTLNLPEANGTICADTGSGCGTGGGGAPTWGAITGTLSAQTDLQSALNAKQASLSLNAGTYINGDVCTYSSSGTLLNCNTSPAGTGTVTSIATTAPLTGGTITTAGTIAITKADASNDGYLAHADFSTFNGKQAALSLTPGFYVDGDWCAYTASGTVLNCNKSPPQAALSLAPGTYVDGDVCTYSASGTLLNCNTSPAGSGTVTSIGANSPNHTITTTSTPVTGSGTIGYDVNWTDINAIAQVNSGGINWQDINLVAKINGGGVNWNDVNLLAKINSGGLNWQSINLLAKMNMTGINWYDAANQTGNVNWQNIDLYVKTMTTVGAGAGSVKMYDAGHVNYVVVAAPSSISASGTVTIPPLKSTTGTLYVCVDSSGNLTAATSCSGT